MAEQLPVDIEVLHHFLDGRMDYNYFYEKTDNRAYNDQSDSGVEENDDHHAYGEVGVEVEINTTMKVEHQNAHTKTDGGMEGDETNRRNAKDTQSPAKNREAQYGGENERTKGVEDDDSDYYPVDCNGDGQMEQEGGEQNDGENDEMEVNDPSELHRTGYILYVDHTIHMQQDVDLVPSNHDTHLNAEDDSHINHHMDFVHTDYSDYHNNIVLLYRTYQNHEEDNLQTRGDIHGDYTKACGDHTDYSNYNSEEDPPAEGEEEDIARTKTEVQVVNPDQQSPSLTPSDDDGVVEVTANENGSEYTREDGEKKRMMIVEQQPQTMSTIQTKVRGNDPVAYILPRH